MADFLRDTIRDVIDRIDWAAEGLTTPFFFAGTPQAVSRELDIIKDQPLKFPMIYLFERLRETEGAYMDIVQLSANVNMLFMTVADAQDWSIDQHYALACDLMRQYAEVFKREVFTDRGRFYQDKETATYSGEVNFGKYIERKGYEKLIFNDTMSGCALSFNINIINRTNCQ